MRLSQAVTAALSAAALAASEPSPSNAMFEPIAAVTTSAGFVIATRIQASTTTTRPTSSNQQGAQLNGLPRPFVLGNRLTLGPLAGQIVSLLPSPLGSLLAHPFDVAGPLISLIPNAIEKGFEKGLQPLFPFGRATQAAPFTPRTQATRATQETARATAAPKMPADSADPDPPGEGRPPPGAPPGVEPKDEPKNNGPTKPGPHSEPQCTKQEVNCAFLRESSYQMQNDDDECLKLATSFDPEGHIHFEPIAQDNENVIYGITTDGLTASAWCNDVGWALRKIYINCRRGNKCFGGSAYAARSSVFLVTVGPRVDTNKIQNPRDAKSSGAVPAQAAVASVAPAKAALLAAP